MPIDLVGRAVERMKQANGESVVERAAERMAQRQQAFATPPGAGAEPNVARAEEPERPGAPLVYRQPTVDLDFDRLEALGLITPDTSRTRLAEEFRIIKRPVLKRLAAAPADARWPGLVMVTSSLPAEGKSFVAVNLAMSIALEKDVNVLLVDADTARPSLPHLLGIDASEGLTDLLADEKMSLADVVVPTTLPNLSLLFAGQPNTHVTELLASHRMADLAAQFARLPGDWVVVLDTPPVLATSEASVLALYAGQVVLVVEAQKTSRGAIEESLNLLDGGAEISFVINKVTGRLGREQFGYGYDAGYGYVG